MTAIALLPKDQIGTCSILLSEDWRDALLFIDVTGLPIPLDNIAFTAPITQALNGAANTIFTPSTANGFLVPLAGSATVTIGAQGVGYAVGDHVVIAGGIGVSPAILGVSGIGAGGNITSATMLATGLYSQLPSSPVTQASSTGAGSGATFNLSWVNNGLGFVIPNASLPPQLRPGSYSMKLQAAADGILKTVATVALTVN